MTMLDKLEGRGWVVVDPPEEQDGQNAIARYNGEVINKGLLVGIIEDRADTFHRMYRTGPYDLEVKIDFEIGRGQVKVTRDN